MLFEEIASKIQNELSELEEKPETDVEEIMQKIRSYHRFHTILNQQNRYIAENVKNLEKQLYKVCEHIWEIDRTDIGEHTQYECKICGLGKNHYLYK